MEQDDEQISQGSENFRGLRERQKIPVPESMSAKQLSNDEEISGMTSQSSRHSRMS
jgi:hypothetical protein